MLLIFFIIKYYHTIVCRKLYGYIYTTQLSKAGSKKFNNWLRLRLKNII